MDQAWLIPKPAPTAPQWLPLTPAQTDDKGQELSFVPLAQSLRTRLSRRPMPKRLWASAAAGAAVVVASFVVGMWSVGALRKQNASQVAASGGDWNATPEGSCPPGLAQVEEGPLFAGGEGPEGALAGAQLPRMHRFCLAQLEVSVSEYEQCVEASACEPAQRELGMSLASSDAANDPPGVALECNSGQPGRERYPINCVSFQQAQQYCAWRGGRLPTQGEWEYAAERANPAPAERHRGTLPIGSFPSGATPEGILDLLGNVSEWTTGHVAFQRPSDAEDPSARRELYAVLGGALQPGTSRIASRASRAYMNANARGRNVGFRCASDD
jgi:formylglycine-generating enzyme required for sulfatase activity